MVEHRPLRRRQYVHSNVKIAVCLHLHGEIAVTNVYLKGMKLHIGRG